MKEIELRAPAKINWSLDIIGRRADGYHLLRSLMQSVGFYDTLRLRQSAFDSCRCCPDPGGGENLALRAWRALKAEYGLRDSLAIRIEKRIPLAAGLAGGSTDAAAVLVGANYLLGLGLTGAELSRIGLALGADVPFCLAGGLALVEGIGEIVSPLRPAYDYHLTLVNPGIPLSTAAVYRAFRPKATARRPDIAAVQAALLSGDKPGVAASCGNVLEQPAIALQPAIKEVKARAASLGLAALMSGSGATVWLLARDADAAQGAAEELGRVYPYAAAVATLDQAWPEIAP